VDEIRISPAGDAFYAAANHRPDTDETPHACYEGWIFWVFLGYEGVDEDGEQACADTTFAHGEFAATAQGKSFMTGEQVLSEVGEVPFMRVQV
jgi:hypothetical protein